MRIFEIYAKEVVLREFWDTLSENLEINENESGLPSLLSQANEVIFQKFNINPKDKVYFICGSARLYLYPKLREAFNLNSTIGDLDLVIPDKTLWIQAGLEKEWNEGGIYRPTNEIEAFNIWAPNRASEKYADTKVRPTNKIMQDATNIGGYYYMSLGDIMDYKMALHRDKEQDIVNLITQYQRQNTYGKSEFLRKIASLIGIEKTREFLDVIRN